jgi:hypothetical protein
MSIPAMYAEVNQAAAATVKSIRGDLCGFICTSSTGGTLTIYDNTAASGTEIYSALALTAGQTVTFYPAITMKNGIHVVVGGTGNVKVLYR